MGVVRPTPEGAHYRVDVIYLLPKLGIKKGVWGLRYTEIGLHQLGLDQHSLYLSREHPLHAIPSVVLVG